MNTETSKGNKKYKITEINNKIIRNKKLLIKIPKGMKRKESKKQNDGKQKERIE